MVASDEDLLTEAKKLAEDAGVRQSKGIVQSLSYSMEWMKEDYKLLELTEDLTNALKEGDVLTIRGHSEDEAVICTKNKTYDIKAADTSNSLLLLPQLATPACSDFSTENSIVKVPVLSCFSSYFEVRHLKASDQRLRQLLDSSAYSNSSEIEVDKELLTTENLLSCIQCSEEELMKSLESLGAMQVNGYWRILDINYQEKAFSQILALLEEMSWSWKEVPFKQVCEMLNSLYPDFVLEHCLKTYGNEKDGENRTFELCEGKVCRYYAEYILRTAQGKFNYNEFMIAWKESVPDGMTVLDEHLKGVALKDLNNHPPVIWHFPERDLPSNPAERFKTLFKARVKWTEQDIEPYLLNLLGPNQRLSYFFLKYTRTSKDEKGCKIYSAK